MSRYLKTDTGYSRYTLAFMQYCDWLERIGKHQTSSLNKRAGNKPLPPRNYQVWPILETVERRCNCAWCDWIRLRYPKLKNDTAPGHKYGAKSPSNA